VLHGAVHRKRSLTGLENPHQCSKFFAALGADGKVMFHALEGIVDRSPGKLAFGKFAHVLKAFFAGELAGAGHAHEPDEALDLLGSEWMVFGFHWLNAARISCAVMPALCRCCFKARRAS